MGKKASNFVAQWFKDNPDIVIRSIVDKKKRNKKGSLKRYLVYVYSGDECLNDILTEKGWKWQS